MTEMTKKGAQVVTNDLDRVATLFQQDWTTLGIPQKLAVDFAYRCDLLSDAIEKRAGVPKTAAPDFNPEEIGKEKAGPLEDEPDEAFMKGEFTQQENRELRERYQDGDLGITPNLDPQAPASGKQGFEQVGRDSLSSRLAALCTRVQGHATRCGSSDPALAGRMFRLASALLDVQRDVLTGKTSADHAVRTLQASNLLNTDSPSDKFAALVTHATRVAKKSEDEDDVEEDEGKEAGKIPPQFKEFLQKKKEEKGDDEDDDKTDKKAHGYNLFAQ